MPESEHTAKDVEKVRKSNEDIVFEHLFLIFPIYFMLATNNLATFCRYLQPYSDNQIECNQVNCNQIHLKYFYIYHKYLN